MSGHHRARPTCGACDAPAVQPTPCADRRAHPARHPSENYWFRRHEAAYALVDRVRRPGAAWSSRPAAARGTAPTCCAAAGAGSCWRSTTTRPRSRHAARGYPRGRAGRGPTSPRCRSPTARVDVVVSLQVVEHLWDQPASSPSAGGCCGRAGRCVVTTPNRLTFSPGWAERGRSTRSTSASSTPTELADAAGGRRVRRSSRLLGLRHGPRLRRYDARVRLAGRTRSWPAPPATLARRSCGARVRAVAAEDFVLGADDSTARSTSSRWRSAAVVASGHAGRHASAWCCTPTCRGWRTTAPGRSARSGCTRRGHRLLPPLFDAARPAGRRGAPGPAHPRRDAGAGRAARRPVLPARAAHLARRLAAARGGAGGPPRAASRAGARTSSGPRSERWPPRGPLAAGGVAGAAAAGRRRRGRAARRAGHAPVPAAAGRRGSRAFALRGRAGRRARCGSAAAPAGIWAPECGYAPGLERSCTPRPGVSHFLVDGPALAQAAPPRRAGRSATADVVAFARDLEVTYRVWSPAGRLPGRRRTTATSTPSTTPPASARPGSPAGTCRRAQEAPYDPDARRGGGAPGRGRLRRRRPAPAGRARRPRRAAGAGGGRLRHRAVRALVARGPGTGWPRCCGCCPRPGVRRDDAARGGRGRARRAAASTLPAGSWGSGKDWRVWDGEPVGRPGRRAPRVQRPAAATSWTSTRGRRCRDPALDQLARRGAAGAVQRLGVHGHQDSAAGYARARAAAHARALRRARRPARARHATCAPPRRGRCARSTGRSATCDAATAWLGLRACIDEPSGSCAALCDLSGRPSARRCRPARVRRRWCRICPPAASRRAGRARRGPAMRTTARRGAPARVRGRRPRASYGELRAAPPQPARCTWPISTWRATTASTRRPSSGPRPGPAPGRLAGRGRRRRSPRWTR